MKIHLEEKQKKQSERKQTNKNVKTIQKKKRVKGKRVINLRKVLQENENENEFYCIICHEKYDSPPTEDCIMWVICKL